MKKTVILVLLFGNIVFSKISVDWTLPSLETKPFSILYSDIALDGNITAKEWEKALCFPVRSTFHIAHSVNHTWKGQRDAGAEFYWAWNETGIFFAAIVSDNEVINNMPGNLAYQQDCIEVFIDGRHNFFMKRPYTKGCYQILIKPPVNGRQPEATTFGSRVDGIQCAGKPTEYGYNIELFIPWSAFPDIKQPFIGTNIAVQFMLDDYDSIDKDSVQPFSMSFLGKKDLYKSPERFIPCTILDEPSKKSEQNIFIEVQPVVQEKKAIPLAVEIGSMVFKDIENIKVKIETPNKGVISEKTAKISHYSDFWKNAVRAETILNLDKINEDVFFISVTVKDKNNNTTTVKKPIFFAGNIMSEILLGIHNANIKKLSQTEPFRAAGFLGICACYERIKRAIELNDMERIQFEVREVAARFNVLNKNNPQKTGTLFDLLELTGKPDAQVIVEYPGLDTAVVGFYWAGIPLVCVNVKKFSNPDQAQIAAREKTTGFVDLLEDKNAAGPVIIAGLPARASSWAYSMFYFNIKNFRPEKQLIVVIPEKKTLYVVDSEKIDNIEVDAIFVSDNSDENVKNLIKKYANSRGKDIRFLSIKDAMKTPAFLFVCGENNVSEIFPGFRAYRVEIVKQAIIRIPFRDMLVSVSHPSRWVAEQAANLVIKGNPVSVSEVDAIRKTLVKEFAFSMRSSEDVKIKGFAYCGDLHAHSSFSDGYPTPVGITLESMYCFMDFFALTDHNTVNGASLVSGFLSKNSFNYTFIIGQEITTPNFHMNAYPLKKTINWKVSLDEIIQQVKKQDAIIVWNHPGWTGSEWELSRIDSGISTIGVDAWEHIPAYYYEWKKQEILPPLIGSTDTHDGTFSNPERTIILSSELSQEGVVSAIKNHNTILVSPSKGSDYMYGENAVIAEVWDIISDGYGMKKAKENQIKKMLKDSNIIKLLQEKY
ncbi:MAG TPA: sugar-binding protein [Candidatus Ratteibacteria bacterium]|nr:sugar-binding protein [bacterium]HPC28904.1 sugar-binding protein [bacterium]HRS06725.1 sugar-binding protein [Candidatus Ratteibacteria bacterium]HRV04442.1 sugar-binding protein [Candidatus Ratteibacteria bacterium]